MIKNILDTLTYAKGETENIRIAQGKYNLPDSLKKTIQQLKKENKWEK
jgi:hypothetical protein